MNVGALCSLDCGLQGLDKLWPGGQDFFDDLLDLLGLDCLHLAKRLRAEFGFHVFLGLHNEGAGGLRRASIILEYANVFAAVGDSRVQHLEGDESKLAGRVDSGTCWMHTF